MLNPTHRYTYFHDDLNSHNALQRVPFGEEGGGIAGNAMNIEYEWSISFLLRILLIYRCLRGTGYVIRSKVLTNVSYPAV